MLWCMPAAQCQYWLTSDMIPGGCLEEQSSAQMMEPTPNAAFLKATSCQVPAAAVIMKVGRCDVLSMLSRVSSFGGLLKVVMNHESGFDRGSIALCNPQCHF